MSANVLIADDEALIRQSVRSVLTQEGFEVAKKTVVRVSAGSAGGE